MNTFSKLLAAISALVASVALLWTAQSVHEFTSAAIVQAGPRFMLGRPHISLDLGLDEIEVKHDGTINLSHEGELTVSHE